jgi:putative transposase
MSIGEIKTNYHRAYSGTPKAITVKREGTKWWVNVHCVDVPAQPLTATGRKVGLDLGVVNLVATSDGKLHKGERFGTQTRTRLASAQRALASKQRGSNRRRRQVEEVARLHRKVKNQRMNDAHQLSRQLVNDYDFIVVEDLKVKNMVRKPKPKPDPDHPGEYLPNGAAAKAGLNRSNHDAGWANLLSLLTYKAESAGRTVVTVKPHHTSQTCFECGHVEAGNRLSQAEFRCCACGYEDHADINAARNILRAGS